MNKKIVYSILIVCLIGLVLSFGCNTPVAQKNSFKSVEGNSICKENGKPVIRMFSTTWCPHCEWVKETFDSVAKEYVDSNKIVAYHWQVDEGDNTLTDTNEALTNGGSIPTSELAVLNTFNPNGTIPTFVFGCKYYRIGNGFESQKDLNAERTEFVKIIEQLLTEN